MDAVTQAPWYLRWATGVLAVAAAALAIMAGQAAIGGGTLVAALIALAFLLGVFQAQILSWNARLENAARRIENRIALFELREQKQRHAVDLLADGLAGAIFLCDAQGRIEYANRTARSMFRFEDVVARSVLEVTLSEELERLVLDAAGERTQKNVEMTLSHPIERVVRARAWPEQPEAERVFLSLYDVTDLRHLERVRRDFVANVSHELNTPMTTIRAMVESIHDDERGDAGMRQKYLEKIVSEVDRLRRLTNDLLALSAAESAKPTMEPTNVAEICKVVVAQMEELAEARGLNLSYSGPDSLTIRANSEQMLQVVLNLVDNAINYTQQGAVHVALEEDDDEVRILVKDTGIGIASDHVSRVFERFYRVDKGRSRESGGTGLGLSIVKHIVEAHGGRVDVESALNHGSTFIARLPKTPASPPS